MIARAGQTADFFFRKLIVNKVTSDKYKVLMQVISEVYAFLYCSVLSLGSRVNARRMPHKKSMQISSHRKLLCEFSKLSKFNAFILLGYKMNTDASIFVYKYHPEKTGFNMYTENTQPQLTFLALLP